MSTVVSIQFNIVTIRQEETGKTIAKEQNKTVGIK